MKKVRAVIASVFTALTLICASAMNTFAAELGKSTIVKPDDINNTVKTGDNSQTIILIVAGVAVVALAVIIISIVVSKKKK